MNSSKRNQMWRRRGEMTFNARKKNEHMARGKLGASLVLRERPGGTFPVVTVCSDVGKGRDGRYRLGRKREAGQS